MVNNFEDLKILINELKVAIRDRRTLIMPVLRFAQEKYGKVDNEIIQVIANLLDVPPVKILSTARFYHFFTENGVAKYRIEVCNSISCSLLGSEHIYEYIKRKLGLNDNRENSDFSLNKVGCLGSCGSGPAMLINNILFENLTYEKIDYIIEGLKSGKAPDKILE